MKVCATDPEQTAATICHSIGVLRHPQSQVQLHTATVHVLWESLTTERVGLGNQNKTIRDDPLLTVHNSMEH